MRSSHRRRRITKQQQQQHHRHHPESEQEEEADYEEYSVHQPSQQSYSQYSDNVDEDDDDNDDNDNVDERKYSYSSNSSSSSLLRSSYINVAPLPVFHGTASECPLAHLSRFRRVCRANNASSPSAAIRIFPVTLDGNAALWYDLTVDPALPWPELQSAFLAFFLRPENADHARADLMAIKQGDGERAGMFHLRMQWILKRWPGHGLPDALLKGVFVDGLREDFQDWIVPQRPETLEEAVRLAENWERVRSLRAGSRPRDEGGKCCGFCDGEGHEERECEVRRKMRELWVRSRIGRGSCKEEMGGGGEVGAGGELHDGSIKRLGGDQMTSLGRAVSLGRRQCECWKKYERSSSASAGNAVAIVGEKNTNAGVDQP